MYETGNPSKTNILPSANQEDTLFGWRTDWYDIGNVKEYIHRSTKTNALFYTATVMPYDSAIFVPDPKLPNKMLYIENEGGFRSLVQRLSLEPNKTYRFSFCIASPVALKGMVLHKGEREIIFNNISPINDPDYTKDYYEVVYEFTLPEQFGGEPVDTAQIFVGIQFPAGTIAYVFDPKLWCVDDKKQANLYNNPDFNKGMDNWAFSWGAWFIPAAQGLGVNEFEIEGKFRLKVMDYDESKFVTYYDDSRIDDGEWWTAEDIAIDESLGIGIINGKFLSSNNNPIEEAKMVLRSENDTFSCITDKEGKFSFDNLPEGFYQMYYAENEDGEEVYTTTGFAYNLKAGYIVSVNVYRNMIEQVIARNIQPMIWIIAGVVGVIGIVAGCVAVITVKRKKRAVKDINKQV